MPTEHQHRLIHICERGLVVFGARMRRQKTPRAGRNLLISIRLKSQLGHPRPTRTLSLRNPAHGKRFSCPTSGYVLHSLPAEKLSNKSGNSAPTVTNQSL